MSPAGTGSMVIVRRMLAGLRSWLGTGALALASALLVAFTFCVLYVVLSRFLFSRTPGWAEELPRLLLVWSVFVGIVPVTLQSAHLSTGMSRDGSYDGAGRRAIAVRVLVSLFLAILAAAGLQLTLAGMTSTSVALQLPYAFSYAAVPIGCGLAALGNLLPRDGTRS